MKAINAVSTMALAVGLAMCAGGGVPVTGWILGYLTALAAAAVVSAAVILHE